MLKWLKFLAQQPAQFRLTIIGWLTKMMSGIIMLEQKKQVVAEFKGWSFKYTDSRDSVPGYNDPDLSLKIKKELNLQD